jgi:hypothetical protein
MRHRDLYRIDDLLLRAGTWASLGVLAAAVGVVLVGLSEGSVHGGDPGLAALGRHGPKLLLAALGPVVLLGSGFAMRRRERQVHAIWTLLERNAEISVSALLANSDFQRSDLERAVRFLNNRGLGHYVWDRGSDTIQDGRLGSTSLHFEKCDACGAEVSLAVPVAFHEVPRCPYCHDPVAFEGLEERRREAIEALRAEHRPERSPAGPAFGLAPDFSALTFFLLLFGFWPAAFFYLWLKWRRAGAQAGTAAGC